MSYVDCPYENQLLCEENKQLRAEVTEQARLLGISADKELALRAENERLKAELAESKKGVSRRLSLVMNVAAELEDAANCLQDSEAKKKAQCAATYYRNAAMKGK